jgi:histidine triad (HIT) family protein
VYRPSDPDQERAALDERVAYGGAMSTPCVFCSIISGETPAEIVLEEPGFVAFLDARPVFKGHILLVPREHLVTLLDLPADLRAPFVEASQRLAGAVVAGLGAQGSFVAMNNVVSQSVPHLHLHVVPRAKGDGLRGFFWPRTKYAEGEAGEYADRLRRVLEP